MIRNARLTHYLVLTFFTFDGYADTLVGESAHALCRNPEHVNHVVCRNIMRFLVHTTLISIYPARAVGWMLHLIPFLRGKDVGIFQFGKGIKTVPILLYELKVGTAAHLLGGDVLTREAPVLV